MRKVRSRKTAAAEMRSPAHAAEVHAATMHSTSHPAAMTATMHSTSHAAAMTATTAMAATTTTASERR
jgi:hypothetical protein